MLMKELTDPCTLLVVWMYATNLKPRKGLASRRVEQREVVLLIIPLV